MPVRMGEIQDDGTYGGGGGGTTDISSSWPVGCRLITESAEDPSVLLGFGTWTLIATTYTMMN